MNTNKKGFTLIEMIFCISVILIILLLVIPEVTSKNRIVKEKSCDAQIEVVNSQIVLYEIAMLFSVFGYKKRKYQLLLPYFLLFLSSAFVFGLGGGS